MDNEKNLLLDIIEEISKYKYDLVIFTTFEFSLTFFENHLIRTLPKDTYLMIDASGYKKALQKVNPTSKYLNSLKNKRILVNFQPGVFHSKILLFCGKERFLSYILSANLTTRGYTRNLELISKFQERGIAIEIIQKLKGILKNCSGTASEELIKRLNVFESKKIDKFASEIKIFTNESVTIMNQFLSKVKNKKFKEIVICSPYLDNTPLDTIKNLENIQVEKKFFILQKRNSFTLKTLEYYKKAKYNFCLYKNIRTLHAKFIYLHDSSTGYLLSGSANLTKEAMLKIYKNGNCEICFLAKIPPNIFKTEYLKYLKLKKCTDISELDYETDGAKFDTKEKTPLILESYTKNNQLVIEIFGDFQDYIICIYNNQNKIIKEDKLTALRIENHGNYHTITIRCDFKGGIYRVYLKKDELVSNQSYFTTEKKGYSKEDYAGKVLSKDRRITNKDILYAQALWEYNGIIRHEQYGPIPRFPVWSSPPMRSFKDLYKLLLRGIKKINEYFDIIYDEELEIRENGIRIEELINWELEKILTLQENSEDIESKLEVLRKLNLAIADFYLIEELDEISELFKFNLEFWKLSAFFIYFVYLRKADIQFLFIIDDFRRHNSIIIKKSVNNLSNLLLNTSKRIFFPELIEKIQKDECFNKNSIESIKKIKKILDYLNDRGNGSKPVSPAILREFNIFTDDSVKEEFEYKKSAFCPICRSKLLQNKTYAPALLFCNKCRRYYNSLK